VIAAPVESIPARIARRAAIRPNHAAIVDGSRRLTYAEVERQSNILAACLRQVGADQDRCIGIFLDRSAQFIISALAVIKSGAAYLPLDSSTPANRVAAILSDAGAIALVTDSRKAASLPTGAWHVIKNDIPGATRSLASTTCEINPESLAYIIYTSGSRGEPKGVEITYAGLSNLIAWHQSAFGITAADRASQVASLGFDAAVWEIWPYLTAGATVHIADEITRRSPQALRDWIIAEKITVSFVPTGLAEQLIRTSWPAETKLRILLTGGDTLHRRPIVGLPFLVINNYGPTECTVVATSGIVTPNGAGSPSIGSPIANSIALILDESLQPVAPGEVGELCISGALLARGYRNRPQLTSSQFVTRVSSAGEPQRLYRTGDRARLLDNGEIAFLGRLDDQVKIRGYRIELGEIAARLNRTAGVETSVVSVREISEVGPTLVAYVVPASGAQLSASSLRESLASELPDFMVPSVFVSMAELPMMANGKVNTSALPAPAAENLLPKKISEHPVSQTETNGFLPQISGMVASMLGLPSIDAEENFFMVGGHSMLGMELVARIRETFGVRLTLRQLFSAPTVAALSAEVAKLSKALK
jgi:amino acid adenylation domain-containing protein